MRKALLIFTLMTVVFQTSMSQSYKNIDFYTNENTTIARFLVHGLDESKEKAIFLSKILYSYPDIYFVHINEMGVGVVFLAKTSKLEKFNDEIKEKYKYDLKVTSYENYLEEYAKVYQTLQNTFTSKEVVLISLGTLTFIKPVIKKLRQRELKTKILQMPFETINGKQSYSLDVKKEMFKHAYDNFKQWHGKVYFYLCMEDHTLWKDIFGYEYSSNNQFEDFMLNNYMDKINT